MDSTFIRNMSNILKFDFGTIFLLAITLFCFLFPVLYLFPPIPVEKSDALRQTHTKIGLIPPKSNLRNQFSDEHKAVEGKPAKLQSLMIYPVKSCRGIEVSKSKVLPTGLEFDRLYTFAQLKSPFPVRLDSTKEEKSQHKWEFVAQRQFPQLATLKVDLWVPDATKRTQLLEKSDECFIIIRFPWQEKGLAGTLSWVAAKIWKGLRSQPEMEILLPVEFPSAREIESCGYTYEEVKIWKETITALNMQNDLPKELMQYLGVSNKLGLFRVDPKLLREVHRCAPSKEEAGYQPVVGFQDAVRLQIF
jgi:hypothetical protein